jgi:hypothetical protein
MAAAKNRSIRQHHGRGIHQPVNFGNGDSGIGCLDHNRHVSETYGLAGTQYRFLDWLVVNESAVCRVAVAKQHAFGAEYHDAVRCRDGGMINHEFAVRMTSESVDTQIQLASRGLSMAIIYE